MIKHLLYRCRNSEVCYINYSQNTLPQLLSQTLRPSYSQTILPYPTANLQIILTNFQLTLATCSVMTVNQHFLAICTTAYYSTQQLTPAVILNKFGEKMLRKKYGVSKIKQLESKTEMIFLDTPRCRGRKRLLYSYGVIVSNCGAIRN